MLEDLAGLEHATNAGTGPRLVATLLCLATSDRYFPQALAILALALEAGMMTRAIAGIFGKIRLPRLTEILAGVYGPGKHRRETREQRIVRKWLQGE